MEKINLIFSAAIILILITLMSCSKEERDYYVRFYDANDTAINNDTISVEINTVFFSKIEIQTRAGNNPRFFINEENITDSSEVSLKRESFSDIYAQSSELNVLLSEIDYKVDDFIEISVTYRNESGDSTESFLEIK